MTTARDTLLRFHPCQESLEWVGDRTPEQAWNECQRPDWMLWIAGKIGVTDDELRYFARWCALSVLDLWEQSPPDEVLNWLMTGDESLRRAAYSAAWSAALSAAESAAYSAAESAAWSAAESAAYSAAESAAWSAAYSAAESAAAWSAALSAARSAALSAARSAALSAAYSAAWSAQCDELRRILPWSRMARLLKAVRR